jgi:hypothetical protein
VSIPAVRTWCEICWRRDHRCQAQIFIDRRPLCLPCADGDPCSYDRVASRADLERNEDEQESPWPQVYFEPSLPAEEHRKPERRRKLPKRSVPAVESATATADPPLEDSDINRTRSVVV